MTTQTALLNIIIADDDPEMLLTVSSMVGMAGYRSIATQNFEAFKKAYVEPVHAVMLDLVMPGKDSEKIMEFLSAKQSQPPLVFITGSFPEDILKRQTQANALGLNVCDVLIKPFWIDDVTRSLKSIDA
jgi:DNA-binding response OmpR family regulator